MYDSKQQTYTKTEYDIVRAENKRLREELETCEECGKSTQIEGGHHQCWCTACVKLFASENRLLKEFARPVIKHHCWNLFDMDGAEIQDLAEKLGLIVPHLATKDDVDDESDYGVGDTIFKFSKLLQETGR